MAYSPGQVPESAAALPQFLASELRKLQQAQFEPVDFALLRELNREPTKPRNGMVVLADGTNWNPGSGAGVYAYYGAAWVKLG